MNDPLPLPDLLREYGALGILAYVTWWLTKRLNGQLDRFSKAVERLADKVERVLAGDWRPRR